MKDPNLRSVMGWAFAVEAVWDFLHTIASSSLLYRWHITILSQRNIPYLASYLAPALICGAASWAILKKKRFARVWGVVASSAFLLMLLRPHFFSVRFSWGVNIPTAFIGVTGLLIFLLPEKQVAIEDLLEPASEI